MKTLRRAYNEAKRIKDRLDANGDKILFLLTFEEWSSVWEESGHWEKRGARKGKYVMSRKNDVGHYEIGNVFIQLHTQNVSDAHRGKPKPASQRAKIGASNSISLSKRCTVDGINIYPSLKALVEELGWGRNGARSPNFRYIK